MKHQFKDQIQKPAPVVETVPVTEVEQENQVSDIPVETVTLVKKEDLKPATIAGAPLVNFRAEPSANAAVLDILSNGESIKVAETRGDWTAVVARDRKGFVMSKYIK